MSIQGRTIFIVEDNPINRAIYQIIMLRNGATVEFDRWGRETLYRLERFGRVDLIILDLMLGMGDSGYQIFEKIRQLPAYNETPIVAVSAADPSIAIPKTKKMGFSGFIAKPIDDDLFPQQLADIIAGESVWYAGERF